MKYYIIVIAFILVVLSLIYFVFMQGSFGNNPKNKALNTDVQQKNIHDVNRDGSYDQIDENYFNSNLNCEKTLPCWNKVIGKTSDGDNPIYVFDLDINKDGMIGQEDLN